MDEVIKIIFSVIMIGIALSVSFNIIDKIKETNKINLNVITLSNYVRTCNDVCLNNNFITKVGVGEVSKGSTFYYVKNML